jgi:hypothetical protein
MIQNTQARARPHTPARARANARWGVDLCALVAPVYKTPWTR